LPRQQQKASAFFSSAMACAAAHMFVYNATLCACDPGYYLFTNSTGGGNVSSTSCMSLPRGGDGFGDWQVGSVGASKNQSFYFLTPVLSLDVVRRLTQSQAVLLWVALATLLSWFAFCAAVRFVGQDPARHKKLFGARFWVSRLDCIFDNNHYAVCALKTYSNILLISSHSSRIFHRKNSISNQFISTLLVNSQPCNFTRFPSSRLLLILSNPPKHPIVG
jgi:hypothetical protein